MHLHAPFATRRAMGGGARAIFGCVGRWAALACLAVACGVSLARPGGAEPLKVENAPKKEAKKYPQVEEAKQKFLKMDVDGALDLLKAAAKANPDLPNGRVQLASFFFAANRLAEGRAQLEKAVVDAPDDPEPYLIFADLAMREGQTTDAGLLFEKALALSQATKAPDERKKDFLKKAYFGVAMSAVAHEQWEDARKNLAILITVDPESAAAHFHLGRVLFEVKKTKEAYAELQAAARMDEKIASPEATMAKLYERAKDRANADKWMDQAVKAAPKSAKTRIEVAQWFMDTNRLEQAKPQIEEALKLDPSSENALYLAGQIARYSRDFPNAKRYFEKAFLEAPANPSIANELALTLNEMGEDPRQRAQSLAESTYRQNQQSPQAASTLGWIYYKMGRLDEAERLLNLAMAPVTVSPDTAYFYARLAEGRNRTDQAKALLELALKTQGPFAYRQDAQKLFDQLAKRAPSSAPPSTPAAPTGKGDGTAKTP
ncbi:MAG: tetratricopeptide repeat protein [Planctomycetia bacterium]|nr:tetratricopeptide repeat protein [Planctomycetia bacterium]